MSKKVDLDVPVCPMNSFETIPANEAEQILEITDITSVLQDKRVELPKQKGEILRGVHAKGHGCVRATFVINGDIDEQYQVGLFAKPGAEYDAQIRLSNASVEIDDDSELVDSGDGSVNKKWIHRSRGMAIKVYGVDGEIIDEDINGGRNQDFLMINTPEFAFQDVRSYLNLTNALNDSKFGTKPDSLFALGIFTLGQMKARNAKNTIPNQQDFDALKAFIELEENIDKFKLQEGFNLIDLQKLIRTLLLVTGKIQKQVVRNALQVQYFGAAPFLFGDSAVMKFSAAPVEAMKQADFDSSLPENVSPNYLREALDQQMNKGVRICYDFKILVKGEDIEDGQLFIEDATTTWEENGVSEVEQYVNVAKIYIEANQDVLSKDAIDRCENLVFTPWHSLVAHRPIGSINRLRRSVYEKSAKHRVTAA